jgi:hypothetical protein
VSKDRGNEKQDDLITIGFRVKPNEKAIIQDYVNRVYNQFIVDRKTEEQMRMLAYPSSELVTKLVTFTYDSI